ncbi:MAG: glycoside hydrolase family 31 protein [Myxococcaceae bacterium]
MRARLLCLVLLLGCSSKPSNSVTLKSDAATVDLTLEPFGFTVKNAGGAALLTTLDGDDAYGSFAETVDTPTYITQIVPGWDGYQPKENGWSHGTNAKVLESTATSAKISLALAGGTLTSTFTVDGTRVHVSNQFELPAGTHYNKSSLGFSLPADEHFFGLGERYAEIDHRGFSIYSWSEEGALGGGEDAGPTPTNPYPNGPSMTYFPVPFFYSSKGYAVHLETTFRTETHFGSEKPDAWRIAANTNSFDFTVYVNADPKASLSQFTEDTGRPRVPAKWVWGPRRRVDNGETVPQLDGGLVWQLMRELKMPITTIDDTTHFLPASRQVGREAQLKVWVDTLHDAGYKVTAYNNPFVAENDPGGAADYAFGKDAGYFVTDPDGGPSLAFLISGAPLYVAMVDFTNPDATKWYESLLQRTVDLGYDGWMHDFGEYVPRNGRFANGKRGDEMHNLYPVLSATSAKNVLEKAHPDDNLFYVRGGYTGTQAVASTIWGGDPEATFDDTQGLPAMLRGGLNLGLVGVPYWGSDTSGFKCITDAPNDKEVFIRWTEMSAVSPIMEEENACSNPLMQKTKWKLFNDQETIDVYRAQASLHTRLQPYFQALAAESHLTGLPLMRHPFLTHPSEPEALKVQDTYFLGPAIYAAPVVHRGVTTRDAWLPPGARYIDLDDGTVYPGGAHAMIPAPLDKLPLLLVEGQMLPLLDQDVQTLGVATDGTVTADARADVLDVKIALAPGDHANLQLVEGAQLFAERTTQQLGNPGNLTGLADPSTLPSCNKCFYRDGLGTTFRVRMNGSPGNVDLKFNDLHVSSTSNRLIRWEIYELP